MTAAESGALRPWCISERVASADAITGARRLAACGLHTPTMAFSDGAFASSLERGFLLQ